MKNGNAHIFFSSELDSARDWRAALEKELGEIEFSTVNDAIVDPSTVDVALIWKSPAGGLGRFASLRAILSLGAGVNQLHPESLPKGVPLARLVDPGLTRTMVEYAKATVYRYHRNLDLFEQCSRASRWEFVPPKLAANTIVGVLGLGELGGNVAQALSADGFEVLGWSRNAKQLSGVTCLSGQQGLTSLARDSSIVVNVLPLTSETRGLLGSRFFMHCRNVRLINMGRGEHVVDDDLLDALETGCVRAATLDVTSIEPLPTEHRYWSHERILITPHVAGLSSPKTAAAAVADNVRRAMSGLDLLNEVDLVRGY